MQGIDSYISIHPFANAEVKSKLRGAWIETMTELRAPNSLFSEGLGAIGEELNDLMRDLRNSHTERKHFLESQKRVKFERNVNVGSVNPFPTTVKVFE
jgi:hypothetical protein